MHASSSTPASGSTVSQPQDQEKRQGRKPNVVDRLLLVARRGHPETYPNSLKWLLTILLAAAAFLDPISYTMLYPALPQLPTSLHTTADVSNLSSTLSFIGPAVGPLYWSYLAERKGRRIALLSSLAAFALFSGLSGAASSIGMLIAMRVLGSFCSCAGTVAGAAMVADTWPPKTRGLAMSIFYLGPLTGPALGPVIGGVLVEVWGWRAVQWFLAAYTGVVLILVVFFLPETLRLEDRSASLEKRRSSSASWWKQTLLHLGDWICGPLRIVAHLRYPAIAVTVLIASVCFAAVVMSATTLQEAFHNPPYEYSYIIVGLLYLPMALGLIIGGLLSGKWSDYIMRRESQAAAKYNTDGSPFYTPESRIKENTWLSVTLLPGALLMYGWTLQYAIFWFVPIIAWFIIGLSTGLMFGLVTTILTELVPQRSASLVGLNALGRNSFAAVSGSITQPLATAIGSGWSYTGLSVFALLNVLAVIAFQRYGRQWREVMDESIGIIRNVESEEHGRSNNARDNVDDSEQASSIKEEKVGLGPQIA